MRQHEADQMIRAEQSSRHRCLELVRHPARRAWVQLGRCVDETARAAAPINETLDEAGRKQRDGGNTPIALRLGHGGRLLSYSPEGGCMHVHVYLLCCEVARFSWLTLCRRKA